ncbi:uncharacterized protein YdbL (DUF1318 family) [Azospirillum lipoferum]|uniref:DUF1318 domain-containing protein n=1 Tax=Azospirillum lipoferum TaxID=193 RepID=A0A5A9GGJ5_AZOLI|nr:MULTISPECIES: YdbL family protein [Azospirillum]KAA0593456.1 DUF1318 domain-containing protein [Azospirillum lipoferum]MCP1609091.1 uncharacterized protein YdbL (DUF1318 family) [Azospirillum lipoferum]MDW5535597.1 YdbL family protein [Azospirillum sp. NL1]
MTKSLISRRHFNRLALYALAAGMLTAALPQLALAQDALATAKAAGQLGERPDGMVGVVPGAPDTAQVLAQQVNAQRLARYQEIAKGNGTALDKVQAVAGQQLIERTPAGQYVMTAAGQWQRK